MNIEHSNKSLLTEAIGVGGNNRSKNEYRVGTRHILSVVMFDFSVKKTL